MSNMSKKGASVDDQGNAYNYIVVIDAGSKGTRAHVYRAKAYGLPSRRTDHNDQGSAQENGDDTDDTDDEEDDHKILRDWKEKTSNVGTANYPIVEFIHRKKMKPGIAAFADNPKKLGKKYFGKLLSSVEKYIPKDQISRTPIFLHATGGMRLLMPEYQSNILNTICSYIQDNSDFFLPDCATHINSISGETEGLYSWIGLNYKFGVLDHTLESSSTYGALDMGGVSSQIAFEPSNVDLNDDYFFKVQLNYMDPQDTSKFHYKVFSESFLGGINQAHEKYDEYLIKQDNLVDPCLPQGYIKTVKRPDGIRVDVKGSSDFKRCLQSLYAVLDEISVDKYCNTTDATSAASCLLSDNFPKMDFNMKKFIGINEIYSNLKEFMNYKDSYEQAEKLCSSSYTDLLQQKELVQDEDEEDIKQTSELCFKASWIINILHQGVGFPRYGIDEEMPTDSFSSLASHADDFAILDGFSWTLGRAVLYAYTEAAMTMANESDVQIGYYEPSSKVFIYGAEQRGISTRPSYIEDYFNSGDDIDKHQDKNHNDKDNDADWDDVFEEHRWWGSLVFLIILLVSGYLLMGRSKRQSIKDAFMRVVGQRFTSTYYSVNDSMEIEDLEMQTGESLHHDDDQQDDDLHRKKDSFEIE